MRKASFGASALVAVIGLAACGGSSTAKSPSATSSPNEFENASWDKAGPNPSVSARMVCSKEARADIRSSLGVTATRVTKPTWDKPQHVYSCAYVYPRGRIELAVKELSSGAETTGYFDRVLQKYGKNKQLFGLGQGAWILRNSDVVVRKDYKVLLVDVSGVPENFVPAMRRSDVGVNVAAVIMSCWTGA